MPALNVTINVALEPATKRVLLKTLSKTLSKAMGKPEAVITIKVDEQPDGLIFGGTFDPAALIHLNSIGGLDGVTNVAISAGLTAVCTEVAGIDKSRVFVCFHSYTPDFWGFQGTTVEQVMKAADAK